MVWERCGEGRGEVRVFYGVRAGVEEKYWVKKRGEGVWR